MEASVEAGGGVRAAARLIGQHDVAGRVARRLARGVHEVLEHVREGPVADVVHQPRQLHALDVVLADAQLGLVVAQVRHRHAGQVAHADRVFLAAVVGRWVDVDGAAQLLDLGEALVLWSVQHADQQRLELDLPVQAVLDHLALASTATTGGNAGRDARRGGLGGLRRRVGRVLAAALHRQGEGGRGGEGSEGSASES